MYNELIVVVFNDEADALNAKQALVQFRSSPFLGILNAIVVTRDNSGKIVVHQQWELHANQTIVRKQMPRVLVEAFFGLPEEEGEQKLIRAGVDGKFARKVITALRPNTSLFLSYLYEGSMVDSHQVRKALSQLKGTLYHTTIPPEVEQAILKQTKD